jgi:hypothetical protein
MLKRATELELWKGMPTWTGIEPSWRASSPPLERMTESAWFSIPQQPGELSNAHVWLTKILAGKLQTKILQDLVEIDAFIMQTSG